MYDLHCHLLPAIDDGPVDLDTALEMARLAVADGITTIACTPHIYPGVYENTADGIRSAIDGVSRVLTSTSLGITSLCAGTSKTSSKVRASLSWSSSMAHLTRGVRHRQGWLWSDWAPPAG